MDSNHRCLGVGQKSSPLDHGIKWKVDSSGIAPLPFVPTDRARFAGPMSCCWTMSPALWFAFSGSRGTRTHKRVLLAACVQAVFDYRGPSLPPPYRSAAGPCFQSDDFRTQIAGAGIGPTSRRSERRILPLDDPAERSRVKGLESRAREEVRHPFFLALD